MTTNAVQIELDPRELMRKKVGRLRREGIVPVHLYGPGMEPRALQCQASRLIQVLAAAGGATPIQITIQGESENHLAFAREIQWDPKRDDLLHVDLLAADVSRPVTAQVPITLVGESVGARNVSGTIMQQLRTVDIQALPLEMPGQIEVDISVMEEADSVIRVSDLPVPESANILSDLEELVVRIELPRVAEEVAIGGEEDAEGSEGDGGGQGRDGRPQRRGRDVRAAGEALRLLPVAVPERGGRALREQRGVPPRPLAHHEGARRRPRLRVRAAHRLQGPARGDRAARHAVLQPVLPGLVDRDARAHPGRRRRLRGRHAGDGHPDGEGRVRVPRVGRRARGGRAQADGLQGDDGAHGALGLHVVVQAQGVVDRQAPAARAVLSGRRRRSAPKIPLRRARRGASSRGTGVRVVPS